MIVLDDHLKSTFFDIFSTSPCCCIQNIYKKYWDLAPLRIALFFIFLFHYGDELKCNANDPWIIVD